ncbi:GH25 family lysozyme [Myceligenerans xiligouense]|uniref:Lysozyme n=1 Tax=Myceligenerans xiligouense TaxID=253184 RepID=A0A3N4YT20_9MICO|nr:GH25 family lysozyme [Myceligenerans xiligouense]RPF23347.1 lysozyme [Myceligenerans xiligouense]
MREKTGKPSSNAPVRRRRWVRPALGVALTAVVVLAVLAVLVVQGVVWPNRLLAAGYDARGIDVSHHNGTIDWERVAGQDVDFAYIKATEGSRHVDERFGENWRGAREAGLVAGAYHFMSFESPGEDQAANLVDTVPPEEDALPPVVDLEPYGEYHRDLPPADHVHAILDPLLDAIEDHYGLPAAIYTTNEAYDAYLAGRYPDNPVWIRAVALPPRLSDGRDWTIWQYSNRDKLEGVGTDRGAEPYVDMNVLDGTLEEVREARP